MQADQLTDIAGSIGAMLKLDRQAAEIKMNSTMGFLSGAALLEWKKFRVEDCPIFGWIAICGDQKLMPRPGFAEEEKPPLVLRTALVLAV
jgi:hypothetical protein